MDEKTEPQEEAVPKDETEIEGALPENQDEVEEPDPEEQDRKAERIQIQRDAGVITPDKELNQLLNSRFGLHNAIRNKAFRISLKTLPVKDLKEVKETLAVHRESLVDVNNKIVAWAERHGFEA